MAKGKLAEYVVNGVISYSMSMLATLTGIGWFSQLISVRPLVWATIVAALALVVVLAWDARRTRILARVGAATASLASATKEGSPHTQPVLPKFDWSNPAEVLTAHLEQPIYRGADSALEAAVVLLTFRELPSGTRVIRWSATFTMDGITAGKADDDGADKELLRIGKTSLGRPRIPVPLGGQRRPWMAPEREWRNIEVAAKVVAELRERGRADPIILKVDTPTQVCMVS